MYYLLGAILFLTALIYFNVIPQLSNKFWRYVDYTVLLFGFVVFLSRIPPFLSGVVLSAVLFYAWQKGFFNKFR